MASAPYNSPKPGDRASVGEVVQFVKTYAQQETVGPLKGAGRWILWGALGAIGLGLGFIMLLLGLLRLLQTEIGFSRGWSFVPYLIVTIVSGVVLFLAVRRIDRTYLNRNSQ